MIKAFAACAMGGFLIGVVGTELFPREPDLAAFSDFATVAREPQARNVQTAAAIAASSDSERTGVFADRLAQYASASESDDRELLLAQARAALREPLSLATTTQIEILLGRLFEVDSAAAAEVVASTELPAPILSAIFRLWAEVDSQAAIRLLDRIEEPSEKRLLALAVIDVVGVEAIDSIVAEAPVLGADGLAVAAIVERAKADPVEALQAVSSLKSLAVQEAAITEIARIAAGIDPEAALAAAESIGDHMLKRAYLEPLYVQWSLADLPTFFAHLETVDPRPHSPVSFGGFQVRPQLPFERALAIAADSDPQRALDFGRELGNTLGLVAETSALSVLSAQDPAGAISYLASVPAGQRRDELTASLAAGYARYNFDAALDWATRLQPPQRRVKNAVVQVLAEIDLARAVRMEAQNPVTSYGRVINSPAIPAWFQDRMIGDFNDPAGIAEQIAAAVDDSGRWKAAMLNIALPRWAIVDPNGALAWMQDHGAELSADAVANVADQLVPQAASLDVERLIGFGGMLEGQARGDWIGRVVERVASTDPNLGLSVAARYRNESFYESLLTYAARAVTSSKGPEEAARLLGPSMPGSAALSIGGRWADRDPERAAAWAVTLQNPQARSSAASAIASRWAARDLAAATGWARGLPDGEARERALRSICSSVAEAAGCD